METKSKAKKLDLIDQPIPIFLTGERQMFKGAFPPTRKDVLLQFYGYHDYKQRLSNRQSKKFDAVKLVCKDIEDWWRKSGIRLKTSSNIEIMISKLIRDYKLRNRYYIIKKVTDLEKQKRISFIESLEETCWVVSPEHEKLLQESGHEDWFYLERVRGKNRGATIGSVDTDLHKKRKRLYSDQESLEVRRRTGSECFDFSTVSSDFSRGSKSPSSDSSDSGGSEYAIAASKQKKRKIEGIPIELLLVSEKSQSSIRDITQMTSALIKSKGESLDDYNLSVSTTYRRMTSLLGNKAKELIEKQLSDKNQIWALQWDGKIIKSLQHAVKGSESLAVLLTGTDGKEVMLSISEVDGQPNAENEANHILSVLKEYNVRLSHIAALVFDTTSLNTGSKTGIVVRLEAEFGRHLLQLGCRHHIYELICGASCEVVYGSGTGPTEPLFKKLIDNWGNLELTNYSSIELPRNLRGLSSLVKQVVLFLEKWLKNSSKMSLRHDYLELASISLLFLGGNFSASQKPFTFKMPGAIHRARWMSKAIYTLKIALFRKQLGEIYGEKLKDIFRLAIFISVFYTKSWLTCTNAADAAFNDLELLKTLINTEEAITKNPKSWPSEFLPLIKEARMKLVKHLWYLSERLVPFAFFSDHVTDIDKKNMRDALLEFSPSTNTHQLMPDSRCFGVKLLKDFIGSDSWTMFKLLGIDSSFLYTPVSEWYKSDAYLHGKNVLSNLPVVNDAAERALGMATDRNTKKAPKSKEKKQASFKVVNHMRKTLNDLATSSESVTKRALNVVKY